MVIDEEKRYILTNYKSAKKGAKASDTDHATEYLDLNIKVITEKPKRIEVWNYKNKKAQYNFKIQTSETKEFSNCFENNIPVLKQIVLKSHCRKSFREIRVTKKVFAEKIPHEV